jgi:hypothetical protein
MKLNISVLMVAALLTGCGGGGGGGGGSTTSNSSSGSSDAITTTPTNTPPVVVDTVTQLGIVADGYLAGANVCLDTNADRSCLGEATTVVSDSEGRFSIDATPEQFAQYPVVSEVVEGVTTDLDRVTDDNPTGVITEGYFLMAPPGLQNEDGGVFLSPLTTLVENQRQRLLEEDPDADLGDVFDEALEAVSVQLGIDEDSPINLTVDYVAAAESDDSEVRALAQKTHVIARVTAGLLADVQKEVKAVVANGGVDAAAGEDKVALSLALDRVTEQLADITESVEAVIETLEANEDLGDTKEFAKALAAAIEEQVELNDVVDADTLAELVDVELTVVDVFAADNMMFLDGGVWGASISEQYESSSVVVQVGETNSVVVDRSGDVSVLEIDNIGLLVVEGAETSASSFGQKYVLNTNSDDVELTEIYETESIVLSEGGWSVVSGERDWQVEADGSVSGSGRRPVSISADVSRIDLAGLKVSAVMELYGDDDSNWKNVLDRSSVFSNEAVGYVIQGQVGAYKKLNGAVRAQDFSTYAVLADLQNSEGVASTIELNTEGRLNDSAAYIILDDLDFADEQGDVLFLQEGLATFLSVTTEGVATVLSSVSYEVVSLNGESILQLSIPGVSGGGSDYIQGYVGFSEYQGQIHYVRSRGASVFEDILFNEAASNELLEAVNREILSLASRLPNDLSVFDGLGVDVWPVHPDSIYRIGTVLDGRSVAVDGDISSDNKLRYSATVGSITLQTESDLYYRDGGKVAIANTYSSVTSENNGNTIYDNDDSDRVALSYIAEVVNGLYYTCDVSVEDINAGGTTCAEDELGVFSTDRSLIDVEVERRNNAREASLVGVVADGYLDQATVCVDEDVDRTCLGEAYVGLSDGLGQYNLTMTVGELYVAVGYPLTAVATAGVTRDADRITDVNPTGVIAQSFTLTAPPGSEFISPFTTLVESKRQRILAANPIAIDATNMAYQYVASKSDAVPVGFEQEFLGANYIFLKSDLDLNIATSARRGHIIARVLTGLLADAEAEVAAALQSGAISAVDGEDRLALSLATEFITGQLNDINAFAEQLDNSRFEYVDDAAYKSALLIAVDSQIAALDMIDTAMLLELLELESLSSTEIDTTAVLELSEGFWVASLENEGGGRARSIEVGETNTVEVYETDAYFFEVVNIGVGGSVPADGEDLDPGSVTYVEFSYDPITEALVESGETTSLVLTPTGWMEQSEDLIAWRSNSDGAISGYEEGESATVVLASTARQIDLSGFSVASIISRYGDEGDWNDVLDASAVFAQGSTGYLIEGENSARLQISDLGSNQVVGYYNGQGEGVVAALFSDMFSVDESSFNAISVGGGVILALFEGSDAASFHDFEGTLLGSSSYQINTISGVEVLEVLVPAQLADNDFWHYDGDGQPLAFAEYNGLVRFVEIEAVESFTDLALNAIAKDSVTAALKPLDIRFGDALPNDISVLDGVAMLPWPTDAHSEFYAEFDEAANVWFTSESMISADGVLDYRFSSPVDDYTFGIQGENIFISDNGLVRIYRRYAEFEGNADLSRIDYAAGSTVVNVEYIVNVDDGVYQTCSIRANEYNAGKTSCTEDELYPLIFDQSVVDALVEERNSQRVFVVGGTVHGIDASTVCLDSDGDSSCLGESYQAITDSEGYYSFDVIATEYDAAISYPVIAANDDYYLTAPAGSSFVSPQTTLVENKRKLILADNPAEVNALAMAYEYVGERLGAPEGQEALFLSANYLYFQNDADEAIATLARRGLITARVVAGLLADAAQEVSAAVQNGDIAVEQQERALALAIDLITSSLEFVSQFEIQMDDSRFEYVSDEAYQAALTSAIEQEIDSQDVITLQVIIELLEIDALGGIEITATEMLALSGGVWLAELAEDFESSTRVISVGETNAIEVSETDAYVLELDNIGSGIVDQFYTYDWQTESLVAEELETDLIVLGGNGWVVGDAPFTWTTNEDGTVTGSNSGESSVLNESVEQIDISGLSVAAIMRRFAEDGDELAKVLADDAVFAPGSTGYLFGGEDQTVYEIAHLDGNSVDAFLNGISFVTLDELLASGAESIEILAEGASDVDPIRVGGNTMLMLNGDGTAVFTDSQFVYIAHSNYEVVTVGGVDIIEVDVPQAVTDSDRIYFYDGEGEPLAFAEYEGQVRFVFVEKAESFDIIGLNATAKDSLLDVIDVLKLRFGDALPADIASGYSEIQFSQGASVIYRPVLVTGPNERRWSVLTLITDEQGLFVATALVPGFPATIQQTGSITYTNNGTTRIINLTQDLVIFDSGGLVFDNLDQNTGVGVTYKVTEDGTGFTTCGSGAIGFPHCNEDELAEWNTDLSVIEASIEALNDAILEPTYGIGGEVALGGYLADATVCIDTDNDRSCLGEEMTTLTNELGVYDFQVPQSLHAQATQFPIVVEVVSGVTRDSSLVTDGNLFGYVGDNLTLVASPDYTLFISPFTTLVENERQRLLRDSPQYLMYIVAQDAFNNIGGKSYGIPSGLAQAYLTSDYVTNEFDPAAARKGQVTARVIAALLANAEQVVADLVQAGDLDSTLGEDEQALLLALDIVSDQLYDIGVFSESILNDLDSRPELAEDEAAYNAALASAIAGQVSISDVIDGPTLLELLAVDALSGIQITAEEMLQISGGVWNLGVESEFAESATRVITVSETQSYEFPEINTFVFFQNLAVQSEVNETSTTFVNYRYDPIEGLVLESQAAEVFWRPDSEWEILANPNYPESYYRYFDEYVDGFITDVNATDQYSYYGDVEEVDLAGLSVGAVIARYGDGLDQELNDHVFSSGAKGYIHQSFRYRGFVGLGDIEDIGYNKVVNPFAGEPLFYSELGDILNDGQAPFAGSIGYSDTYTELNLSARFVDVSLGGDLVLYMTSDTAQFIEIQRIDDESGTVLGRTLSTVSAYFVDDEYESKIELYSIGSVAGREFVSDAYNIDANYIEFSVYDGFVRYSNVGSTSSDISGGISLNNIAKEDLLIAL